MATQFKARATTTNAAAIAKCSSSNGHKQCLAEWQSGSVWQRQTKTVGKTNAKLILIVDPLLSGPYGMRFQQREREKEISIPFAFVLTTHTREMEREKSVNLLGRAKATRLKPIIV